MTGLFDEPEDVDESPKGNQPSIIESDAFPLRVLAGAGTGKTFTMVRKVERLLETDDVAPRKVLALTFTNQAADSMRSKLNDRIGADGFDIDAYTYQSICNSILNDYPYHAGLDSNFDITTDADEYELAREAVEEVPARFVNPEGSYRKDPHEILLSFISTMKQDAIQPADLDAYLPEVEALLELEEMTDRIETEARDHIRRGSLSESSLSTFEDELETFEQVLRLEQAALGESPLEQDVYDYLGALIDACTTMAARIDADQAAIVEGHLQPAAKIPGVLFSAYGSEGRQMTRKGDFPTGIPKLPFTLVDRLREYISQCQRAADFLSGYQEYERLREARDLLDFDDLIRHTVELLQDKELAAEIAGQWEYIFCDEFQDTDSIQFELVTALAQNNRVFVVGDDDQAIYEWRGADSDNIGDKLDTAYPSLTDERLELNFRSRQPILDLANNAIEALEGRESDKMLSAFGEKGDSEDGVAVVDTTPPEESDLDSEDHEATQITTAIAGLVRGDFDPVENSYDLGDIAILVRKKRHARPLIDSFEEAGIPFELVGDLSTDSVGVETVLAYLRLLATPEDDVSARRVLLLRYRLCEADLEELTRGSEPLVESVRTATPEEYSEPDRIAAAQADFEHLFSRRNTLPVEQLYHELLTTTDLELYLTTKQQRELRSLEEVISGYGTSSLQPSIGPEFVDYLDDRDTIIEATDAAPTEQAESAGDGVTIMTVHKAKGLDFPVVMMPQLTADEWEPGSRDYEALKTRIDGTPFWAGDPVRSDKWEQRRLLHVGITRAEEQLILFGHGREDSGGEGELSPEYIRSWMGDAIDWDFSAGELEVWELIQSSLPPTAEDWTAAIAGHAVRSTDTVATHRGHELNYESAIETTLSLADDVLAGTLDDTDPSEVGVRSEALAGDGEISVQRQHSYTSLGTVETCARKHYLDHVVYGYEIPASIRLDTDREADAGHHSEDTNTDTQTDTAPTASTREIGILFHETAEAATKQDLQSNEEWRSVCHRLAGELDLEQALEPALQCVDRFFETPVAEWERLSAERSFNIEIDGYTVVGDVDLIARDPDGDLVVIDYKATTSTKSESNRQLPLYLLACEKVLDTSVARAGYVYVNDIGPAVDIRSYDDETLGEARDNIIADLQAADQSGYQTYTAGEHCKYCAHNELPCSQH